MGSSQSQACSAARSGCPHIYSSPFFSVKDTLSAGTGQGQPSVTSCVQFFQWYQPVDIMWPPTTLFLFPNKNRDGWATKEDT